MFPDIGDCACLLLDSKEGSGKEKCIPAPVASAAEPPVPARKRITVMTAMLFEAPEAAVNIISSGKEIQ